MKKQINPRDLLLENESLRKELHRLTQTQNDNLICKQQLDAILDNAPVELYLKDREGRYIKINKQFEKIFKVKNEDLIGLLPTDVHYPKLAASTRDHDLTVLNSGKVECRNEIVELGDEMQSHTLFTMKFPVFNGDGEVDGLGAIVTDISEVIATKEKLRKSNALFNKAEQIGKLGHWEWDVIEDRYFSCSEQFANIHGMTAEQLIKIITSMEADHKLICEADRERYIQVVDAAWKSKQGWDIEYRIIDKTSNWVYIHEIGEPVLDDHGAMIKTIGTIQDITEIVQAEESLQESHTLYRQAEAMGNVGHWRWDLVEDKMISCSDQYARMYDMTVAEALDYFISTEAELDLVHPDDKELYKNAEYDSDGQFKEFQVEYRVITFTGKTRHLYTRSKFVYDNDGAPSESFGTVQDFTKIRRMEVALHQSHALFQQAEAMGNMGHFRWDRKGDKMISCSEQYAKIYSMTVPKVLEHFTSTDAAIDLIHPDDRERYRQVTVDSNSLVKGFDVEYRIVTPSGDIRHVHEQNELILDSDSAPSQSFGTIQDITESKQAEEKLERLAHYDLLTNLPNRVLLADRLSHAMVQCQRRNLSLAVAYMDLDGFKEINDTYGHHMGDELLIALSQRMKEALREGDTLARIGGDEFIAVMVDLEKIEDSELFLKRLLKAAADPVTLGDAVVQVSASIGVTLYPKDDVDSDRLIRHADQAMYVAKQAGKNRYHLFDTAQDI